MCGRFALFQPAEAVAEYFQVEQLAVDFGPRYNIAPTQPVATVIDGGLAMCRWGLIPSWARDPKIGSRLINARAETLPEKPAFRSVLRRRRCLVLASGFYEWKLEGDQRVPMYIYRSDAPLLGFAGLWDEWRSPEGEPLRSCAIVTTAANGFMAPIHARMPAILDGDRRRAWLDPGTQDPAALLELLTPCPPGGLAAHVVSRQVNRPTFDEPACVQPVG